MAKRDFPVPEKAGKQETSTQASHDAETVRLVREWADNSLDRSKRLDYGDNDEAIEREVLETAIDDILAILNRPAKKGKKNG